MWSLLLIVDNIIKQTEREVPYPFYEEVPLLYFSTVAFTLDVYGHVNDKMRKASADRMQAYIDSIGV